MTIRTDIAEAVTNTLNAGSFTPAFTAERSRLPVHDVRSLKGLTVMVVPKGLDEQPANRTDTQIDVSVDVAVQQKCDRSNEAVDRLADLVEQIIRYMRRRPLTGATYARYLSTENAMPYYPPHLEDEGVFTSVITLTYRVIEDEE